MFFQKLLQSAELFYLLKKKKKWYNNGKCLFYGIISIGQYNEIYHFIFQFSQLVSSDLKVLGRSSYTLCSDGQLLIRQVLHPETSKKV